jgi:shikimate dehydrogenase
LNKIFLLGFPLGHTLSPIIYSLIQQVKWGQVKFNYAPKEISPENFNEEIKKIISDEEVIGFNVTLPYKTKILEILNDKIVRDTSVVNTGATNAVKVMTNESGLRSLKAYNTDYLGLKEIFQSRYKLLDFNFSVLIIGAQGSARATLRALADFNQQKRKIYMLNRDQSKIEKLKLDFPELMINQLEKIKDKYLVPDEVQLIIHATSWRDQNLDTFPFQFEFEFEFQNSSEKSIAQIKVLDLNYQSLELIKINPLTNFLKLMKQYGCHDENLKGGEELLFNQAIFNWNIFFPSDPLNLNSLEASSIKRQFLIDCGYDHESFADPSYLKN